MAGDSQDVGRASAAKSPRILPPTYFLAHLIAAAGLFVVLPGPILVGPPWSWSGIAIMALGLVMIVQPARVFDQVGTTIKPFEVSQILVTSGFFRISRNPMYLGMVIVLVGLCVTLGASSPWITIPTFVFLMNRCFIRKEEVDLSAKFGEQFAQYRSRVRRWI